MLTLEYRVHSAAQAPTTIDVEVDGETVQATVPALTVELLPNDHRGGTLTLRLVGKERLALGAAIFQPEAVVTVSVATKEG